MPVNLLAGATGRGTGPAQRGPRTRRRFGAGEWSVYERGKAIAVVATRRDLPDLRAQLRRRQRRRDRRPTWDLPPPALPQGSRRRRSLADPLLCLAHGRWWLRRRKLSR